MNEAQYILKMLAEGSISAEEANRLLNAAGQGGQKTPAPQPAAPPAGEPAASPPQKVLARLHAGQITAAEANTLLGGTTPAAPETISPANGPEVQDAPPEAPAEPAAEPPPDVPAAEPEAAAPAADPLPDFSRFRRQYWQVPFFTALVVLVISGLLLASLSGVQGMAVVLGLLILWPLFMLALLSCVVLWFSRHAPWVHVRVQEHDGSRFALSLPVPVLPVGWLLRFARNDVDDPAARQQMDQGRHELGAMKRSWRRGEAAPLHVDIHGSDGDHVQVYIG